jgi:hypothetical protein
MDMLLGGLGDAGLMDRADLDSLAGAVAYRHCLPTPSRLLISTPATQTQAFHEASHKAGIYLATASADRLDMFGRLNRANMRCVLGLSSTFAFCLKRYLSLTPSET